MRKIMSLGIAICLCVSMIFASPTVVLAANTIYYVDAVNGNDANNGTSTGTAWKTLTKVNATTFGAGDQILLRRGQTFTGMCYPKGSGSSGAPITLGAYDVGNRPIISGGTNEAAIKLLNQQYWIIKDIETTGGNPRGISVQNSTGTTLNYFRVVNCVVHNVGGTDTTKPANDLGKKKGLITFWAENGSTNSHFNDIIVDQCLAYTTQRWAGIIIYSNASASDVNASTNVTVKNCTVYDTYGEGIAAFAAKNWVILENNVVHDIGKMPTNILGTPNGIWTWRTNNAVVRNNEVYLTHSPGVDGGAFDIDYYNTNNWVEYNYAHDCDAYGAAIFAATDDSVNSTFNGVTNNAIVRYNIFANNGREAGSAGSSQGDFYITTWNGGTIDGVQIYNNTSYWNPAQNDAAVVFWNAGFTGSNSKVFKNNLIYSTVPKLIATNNNNISFNNNLYWYTGAQAPQFTYNNSTYSSFSSYQSGSGQDAQGKYANPLLNNPTYHSNGKPTTQFTLQSGSPAINAGVIVANDTRDFLGNTALQGGAYDIGACESSFTGGGTNPVPITNLATNPSFESNVSQTPTGWNSWSGTNTYAADYTETFGGAHSGANHLTHYNGQTGTWNVYTYQTKTGLTNGTYTLKAWVRKSGSGFTECQLEAKDFGGTKLISVIPTSTTYQQIIITGITVSNGQCTFGFCTQVTNGTNNPYVYMDDVEFYKN